MRYLASVVVLFLAALAPCSVEAETAPLRIVFIAYQNPDQLAGDVKPVIEYLKKALGRDVKSFVSTDYAGIVEALRNETADAGFMGPLQYVIAHQQSGARALLGEVYNGSATYQSKIFVRKDSGITSIEQLKGRTMAFVDPISSSGYLYPMSIFRDEKLVKDRPEEFFKRIYFAGGDEQAIRAVYNKFVDAAGIGEFAYNLLRPDERDAVTSIAVSRPIPSHCIVVRKGLPEKIAEDLAKALLALNEDGPNHALLQQLYSVDGYVRVNHETYAGVERLARDFDLVR